MTTPNVKNCMLAFMAAVRTRVLPANLSKTRLSRNSRNELRSDGREHELLILLSIHFAGCRWLKGGPREGSIKDAKTEQGASIAACFRRLLLAKLADEPPPDKRTDSSMTRDPVEALIDLWQERDVHSLLGRVFRDHDCGVAQAGFAGVDINADDVTSMKDEGSMLKRLRFSLRQRLVPMYAKLRSRT